MNADAIISSLEHVAEKAGDPTPLVYERLFQEQPETRDLFILDKDGGARGNMLQQFIEAILDLAGEGYFAGGLIQTEIINHEGVGVDPAVFRTFFAVTRDTFREILAADWTDDVEAAWAELENRFDATLSS